ncbi:MAG: alpha/beta fold hydrolase [Gemmatimonadota bacterium]
MKTHDVSGGGGLRLHVREWGAEDGAPILFLHGWSQCHLFWAKQYESELADEFRLVAYDLRGHGMSEAPLEAEHYTDAGLWADDIHAIIEALRLERAVLVGHSYGPFIICDYVRAHGEARIGGAVFVGGATAMGPGAFGTFIGPGFLDHFAGATSDDLSLSIPAMRAFLRGMPAKPLPQDEFEIALAWNLAVPARIRANLAAREIDSDDVLRALEVPVLLTHGRADDVVLPAMVEHILEVCPVAEVSWYEGVAHLPNLEAPERFNRELRDFARRVKGSGDQSRPEKIRSRLL